jgi:hypothetical protein
MEKAQEILFHLDELYTENPSEEKVIRQCEENPVRYQAWVDAFKEYDLPDVLQAIDEYWEFKNSKTKPSVAQIKAKLNARNVEKMHEVPENTQAAKGDFAWERMNADIEAGSCRNNLYVYRDAEKIVLNDWLAREIPASVWCKMSYSEKLQQATEKGLLNNFDEALRQAAQTRFGRDFEFASKKDMESLKESRSSQSMDDPIKSLASHWRA